MNDMPLIGSADELTPEFLTGVMRSCGVVPADGEVTSVEAVSFGDDSGLLSFLYRLHLGYSAGVDGPPTVVAKFPTDDPGQRGIADALGFFNRECVFYRVVAPGAPFQAPSVYGMAQAEDSTDFVIIMEDLGHMQRIDQVAGASLDASETALVALAQLHAHYWEHDDLDELSQTFLPIDNPIYHAALPDVFATGWASLKVNAPDLLDERIEAFGDRWASYLPWMLEALNTPRTLVHGDYRSDNLLLDSDGALAVLDFQIAGVGNCAYDLAYFLSSSIASELRDEHGEHLVHLYHDTLTAHGVDLSFEDLMTSYRIGLDFCLIYGCASFAGWDSYGTRQKQLMRTIASRTIAAIIETDALSSLPAD